MRKGGATAGTGREWMSDSDRKSNFQQKATFVQIVLPPLLPCLVLSEFRLQSHCCCIYPNLYQS